MLLVMYDKFSQTYCISLWTLMHTQHATHAMLNFPDD